jgi:hypothetical protein
MQQEKEWEFVLGGGGTRRRAFGFFFFFVFHFFRRKVFGFVFAWLSLLFFFVYPTALLLPSWVRA